MAIQSFGDSDAERFFKTGIVPRRASWAGVKNIAKRKLDMLDYAKRLDDLRSPPNNRLEPLKGDLKGFYSIRINDQFRIIFVWQTSGPSDVQILDYH